VRIYARQQLASARRLQVSYSCCKETRQVEIVIRELIPGDDDAFRRLNADVFMERYL